MTKKMDRYQSALCNWDVFSFCFSCYVHPFVPAQTVYLLRQRSPWGSQFKQGQNVTNFKMILVFFVPFFCFWGGLFFFTLDLFFIARDLRLSLFSSTNRIDVVLFPFGQSLRGVKSTCKAISIAGLSKIPKATQSSPNTGTLYSLKWLIKQQWLAV